VGLDADDTNKIRDQIYFPLQQVPDKFMSAGVTGLTLVLRSGPEPLSMVPAVRAQVAGPTLDQPVHPQVEARLVRMRRCPVVAQPDRSGNTRERDSKSRESGFQFVAFAGIGYIKAARG
jgi:hypothetical protein